MIKRVAIIGAGIGAQHLDGFLALRDKFQVCMICDLDQERAKSLITDRPALAASIDIELVSDVQSVLQAPDIDIVDICLPPHLHFQTILDALDAGKSVICEKPLVTSLADIDKVSEKLKSSPGQLLPVFQYRYGLGTSQLHALIEAGLAGTCYAGSLETHWDRQTSYYDIAWRGTWAGEQGGAILGHAIHIHDLLSSLLGPVARVYAELATRVNTIEVEDCAALSIKMETGAVITSSVTLGAADNMSRLRLMFEGFTVESDHAPYAPASASWHFRAREPYAQTKIDAVLKTVEQAHSGYAGLFDAFHDSLMGNKANCVRLEDARRSLEFVSACYHSSRTASPVILPLSPSHPLYNGWLP